MHINDINGGKVMRYVYTPRGTLQTLPKVAVDVDRTLRHPVLVHLMVTSESWLTVKATIKQGRKL